MLYHEVAIEINSDRDIALGYIFSSNLN